MARLIYFVAVSLDGYHTDAAGRFDWAAPDEEVHAFVNERERSVGTYLLGRRMYEVMSYWETALDQPDQLPVEQDFARFWLGVDKVVYSRTLTEATTGRTRLERRFDPEAVRRLKAEAAADLSVGGPDLAAHALRSGLVDEVCLLVAPVVVGGGSRFLPEGIRLELDLLEERRFGSGSVFLRYATGSGARPTG